MSYIFLSIFVNVPTQNFYFNSRIFLKYGMYIAAGCQNFISWQNIFLQQIIDRNAFDGILHYYVNYMRKKVTLQKSK